MRLNDDKVTHDMLGAIIIEECPKVFRATAENIIRMLNVTKAPDYNSMTELDKRLTVMYWETFDDISAYMAQRAGEYGVFEEWYVNRATSPDLISRARRWLVENRYVIIKTSVAERAQEAGEKWKGAVK